MQLGVYFVALYASTTAAVELSSSAQLQSQPQSLLRGTSTSTGSTLHHHQETINNNHHRQLFEFTSDCTYDESIVPPYYVSPSGNNWNNWGLTPENPFNTIQYAVDNRQPCQTIYVMGGVYQNSYFGQSKNHNNKIVNLNNVKDVKILAHDVENDRPILEFDGIGAFIGGSKNNPVSNIEISGFEIKGPSDDISWSEAMNNRMIKRTYYNGRGIAIWGGHHIYIHDMIVHHCPASGIRVNNGDYVTISDSIVYSNTWYSSSAESAIVLAQSANIDEEEGIKMKITNNVVYDNVNKVPYYNPNYAWDYSPIGNLNCGSYSACEQELIEGCPWECRYGKRTQDYIIDGMGVYVTRNKDTYSHGRIELSFNTCYQNGINGLVFHRTDRGVVKQNLIYDNGVVPRLDKPETIVQDWHAGCNGKSRQPYSGLVLNNASGVKLWSNRVSARYDDDYAFTQEVDGSGDPEPVEAGGNNKACRGLVSMTPSTVVTEVNDESICSSAPVTEAPTSAPTPTPKYVEISCGTRCHLIQWPYKMHLSYSTSTAIHDCSIACDEGDCKAYSIQWDYDAPGHGLSKCFLYYASKEPSPTDCSLDPFNVQYGNGQSCSFPTTDGRFFITPNARDQYSVLDLN